MKKTLGVILGGLMISASFGQTVATDFTTDDCASTSHTLFTELEAGKVIVMIWVMPCGACISKAQTVQTTVDGMANPNVLFYLVDDVGNTSCATLDSWAATNSLTPDASFGNSGNVIDMEDYGTIGMPKVVVLGGTDHTVFYNTNGTVSASELEDSITAALTASIADNNPIQFGLTSFPNPAKTSVQITWSMSVSDNTIMEVFDLSGRILNSIDLGVLSAGSQSYLLNIESFEEGSYFIKLNVGLISETIRLTVVR